MKPLIRSIRSIALLASLSLIGCAPQPDADSGSPSSQEKSSEGGELRLPTGNPEQGRKEFVQFDCHWCHRVQDVPLPDKDAPEALMLSLDQHQLSQPQLLTAITNPEHIFSERYRKIIDNPDANAGETEPLMPSFIGTMTVRQLIDIVAFLEELQEEK